VAPQALRDLLPSRPLPSHVRPLLEGPLLLETSTMTQCGKRLKCEDLDLYFCIKQRFHRGPHVFRIHPTNAPEGRNYELRGWF